ncbi:MAG: tetratricopeptide repeat protein [Deltaproteobacteria bacterium]|nr:tetratricopeptide repeat protein [Deltaproteobacteria bacterium]
MRTANRSLRFPGLLGLSADSTGPCNAHTLHRALQMPFVRRKRGQVLIVRSVRDSKSGAVRQEVLQRFASLPELLAALRPEGWRQLRQAMQWKFPGIRCDWERLRADLAAQATEWSADATGSAVRRKAKTTRIVDALNQTLSRLSPARLHDAEIISENRVALVELRDTIDRLLRPTQQHETTPIDSAEKEDTDVEQDLSESQTKADHIFDQGMEHWWKGDRTRACRLYRQALKLDPFHADAHNHLGIMLLDRTKFADAERHFQAAVEGGERGLVREEGLVEWGCMENRPYLRGLANLALVYRDTERWSEALELHLRILKLNPNDNQGIRWLVGEEYHRLGNLERAIKAYENAAEEPGCCFGLALARFEAGRPSEQVGTALLAGFAANRYIAPMLLGESWERLDGFHATNTAEPEWGADQVRGLRVLWHRVPKSADVLRFWWKAAPIRNWRAKLDEIIVALGRVPPSDKRNEIVSLSITLRSRTTVREMVRQVLAMS